ncbi:MAG TPA: GNAT family N-acetyltransferase [Desulfobacterales bacterium]|nr:GNAT family N-acetyltransferase [Desulfobacterales bacterium]HIP38486.1 GNAT family N-acetyltransferase [Desulfocapsa sulfexigens]
MIEDENQRKINIREVQPADLERCFEIETISYSGDEAASKEKILKRIRTYPEGFVVLELADEVIGFINSGATHQVELSDEEFKELIGHDPDGKHIVIMSVVVHPEHQRRGFASQLMKRFTAKMKEAGKTDIYLICQTGLIDMYASHGFSYLGKSDSDHGGLSWHEMVLTL